MLLTVLRSQKLLANESCLSPLSDLGSGESFSPKEDCQELFLPFPKDKGKACFYFSYFLLLDFTPQMPHDFFLLLLLFPVAQNRCVFQPRSLGLSQPQATGNVLWPLLRKAVRKRCSAGLLVWTSAAWLPVIWGENRALCTLVCGKLFFQVPCVMCFHCTGHKIAQEIFGHVQVF